MIQVTGLWLNKTKDGKTFMSGTMGGVKVFIFKNEKKVEGKKHPDYNLVFGEIKPKDNGVRPDVQSSIPEFQPRDDPFGGDDLLFEVMK